MSFFNIIKNLNYKQIGALFIKFLKHPLYMLATAKATVLTMRIAQKEFPNIHNKHNKANAFRHALWNLLIARESSRFSSNFDEIINWTKEITDWHEDFAPNKEMAKKMDLHNNAFGRNSFLSLEEKSNNEYVEFLVSKLQEAIKVNQKSGLKGINTMIFLED